MAGQWDEARGGLRDGAHLPKTTLVLGGARSGKSALAERLVLSCGLAPIYLATGQAGDAEMAARISHHRARRGAAWRTVEAPVALRAALEAEARPDRAILVDCLTLWVTNLMMADADIEAAADALADRLPQLPGRTVIVSNETGMGIVPDNAMARAFRDHAGRVNQTIAAVADQVVLTVAGLPLTLKSPAPGTPKPTRSAP